MTYKEKYSECQIILKKFIKKEYWTVFTSADLFYVVDKKRRYIMTFVEQFFDDCFGIQLFFNDNGLNYVHDVLTTTNEGTVSIYDCDSICAIIIPKKDLKPEEVKFLHENRMHITENNLIFHRFEPGFAPRIANAREVGIFLEQVEIIASVINNEYDDVIEAFRSNNTVITMVDKKSCEYQMTYGNLPFLEHKPKNEPANQSFVEEFKASTYLNDDCFLFSAYLPAVIKETNIRPMIVYFYYPKLEKHFFKYIMDKPSEYNSCILGILYDVFTQIGMPTKIFFNNRNIFAMLKNTLDMLNIEYDFARENSDVDANVNDLLSKVYQVTLDDTVETKDFISILIESITQALNDLADNGSNEEEIVKPNDLVS